MARRVEVEIIGDSRSLERAFARSERSAKNFGRNMEGAGRGAVVASVGFRGLGRSVAYASGAFLGGAGLAAAVKVGFDEMLAGQAVAADTAAVLKSTGRVAGVTARQVDRLGTSLQQLSGYDDEAIKSAENLILTFTNVRDVAGKNNDIFTQATKSTLDLSRRFDQDLSVSAVQLGKALQDPVRGVTALRRAGISFSAAQQRTINKLVETGHLLEAQKILLREVRTETGGAAEAYGKTMAGQLDILQGNLTNLAGELAQVLNPEVKKLTENFNKWLADPQNKKQVIDGFTSAVHGLGIAAGITADTFRGLKSAWDALPDFGKDKGLLEIIDAKGILRRSTRGTPWAMLQGGGSFAGAPPGLAGPAGKMTFGPPGLQGPDLPGGAAPPGTTPPPALRRGATVAQRNRWFDALVGRELVDVQDIRTVKGQIARLKEISAQISARLAVTKDITRKLTLEDQIRSIARDRRGLQQELFAQTKDDRDAAKERKRLAVENRFGWLDFAVERAQATKTLKDDRAAYKAIEAALKDRIRQEGRTLDLVRDLWRVRQNIRDLNKRPDVDPLAGLVQVSSKRLAAMLAAGTGLGVAGRRVLGANIAAAEIRPVHVHVNLDGREIGRAVTGYQAREGQRTARQTSGRRE